MVRSLLDLKNQLMQVFFSNNLFVSLEKSVIDTTASSVKPAVPVSADELPVNSSASTIKDGFISNLKKLFAKSLDSRKK